MVASCLSLSPSILGFFLKFMSKSSMAVLSVRPEEQKVKCQKNTFPHKLAPFKITHKPHTTFLLIYHCPELRKVLTGGRKAGKKKSYFILGE